MNGALASWMEGDAPLSLYKGQCYYLKLLGQMVPKVPRAQMVPKSTTGLSF